MIAWCALASINFAILFVVNFADLTFGMLMIHFLTYDLAWFSALRGTFKRGVLLYLDRQGSKTFAVLKANAQ